MSGNEPGPRPSDEELAAMSRDDLVKLGGQLDGVEIVDYPDPFPVEGTKAEKRAERAVAAWFLLSAITGLAFVVALIWWPWEYVPWTDESGHFWYSLYTPVLGITMGVSILSLSIGVLLFAKKFIPAETSIQQRSDNLGQGSAELDRKTIVAHLQDAGERSGIARRSMIKRTAGLGVGALGLGTVALPLASFIKDPHAEADNKHGLIHTGWKPEHEGEIVYLRRSTGDTNEVSLVRPEELDAGGMETVFPFRESERGDHEALLHAIRRADNPVMLIRLRPDDAARAVKRQGQEDFNYGDFFAFTKICSHVGCPTSLYEQQTNRILCPCHQSQFDALQYGKPVFGPATRALAQLPITVHTDGYLIARHDFIEPIGPGFWERKS
ncbi:menaquinol-cytochrome C reductase [Saccharomonospora sp. CUA-673]|uniref:cytochrome bc1 complex Rieske iron-sulfur subunit n=1 Tax=Saccharomonospora sp. CUA-673 TaxID=1904969 RepID=UPI00095AA0CC|nr:ubiquinol-cytochrome c reductase iron-sulfur subunit [Saccharomonospora sp. CUA-673]OLT46985.1 menaquinol-cytochrome C reductase [Saccharomonospora sp. CUA-673]